MKDFKRGDKGEVKEFEDEEITCSSIFAAALFTIAKRWKQPKCPSADEWINKMWYICVCVHIYMKCIYKMYTYISYIMDYYSVLEGNKVLIRAMTRMDLEDVMLSERSQTQKDEYCMIPIICST